MGRGNGSSAHVGDLPTRQTDIALKAASDSQASYDEMCELHSGWLCGWSSTHDYDPTWDYDIDFSYMNSELLAAANSQAQSIMNSSSVHEWNCNQNGGYRIFPVDFSGDDRKPIAMYVNGTDQEPVVLIDFAAIEKLCSEDETIDDAESAVRQTVIHELRHAYQQMYELPFDEDEAEYGSKQIPF